DTLAVAVDNRGDGELDLNAASTLGTNPDFSFLGIRPQPGPTIILPPGDSEYGFIMFVPSTSGPDTSLFTLGYANTANGDGDTVLVFFGVGEVRDEVSQNMPVPFSIDISPNPSQSVSSVFISGAEGTTRLTLIDALGRVVQEKSVSGSQTKVDASLLSNGWCVLRASSGQRTVTQTFNIFH
ncbi:MAG TPA: T9SS type A sorting domain-containing protein, partial [Candidatus Kapabacteria bacterium]